jgi:hypothetical protein
VNTGTNIPSVATPNGQAAFLFLLTSAIAPLIRLGYRKHALDGLALHADHVRCRIGRNDLAIGLMQERFLVQFSAHGRYCRTNIVIADVARPERFELRTPRS